MEVKTKEKDYQSVAGYCVGMLVLLVLGFVILIIVFNSDAFKTAGISGAMSSGLGFLALFAIVFLFLAALMLVSLFLPPKEIDAILKVKDEQTYEGRSVTYLLFDPVQKNENPNMKAIHCPCYTEYPNELKVGYTYKIRVKAYNKQILSILNPDKYAGEEDKTVSLQNLSEKQEKKQEKLAAMPILSKEDIEVEFTSWDEKVIASSKLTVPTYINIENLKEFEICSVGLEKQTEDIYFVCDSQNQLIYEIKATYKNPFRHIVSDYAHNPVAIIEHKLLQGSYQKIVRVIGKPAFSVKQTMNISKDYEILGIDYTAMGSLNGSFATTSIFTTDGHMVMEVDPNTTLFSYKAYRCRVNDNVTVTPELLLLAYCVSDIKDLT